PPPRSHELPPSGDFGDRLREGRRSHSCPEPAPAPRATRIDVSASPPCMSSWLFILHPAASRASPQSLECGNRIIRGPSTFASWTARSRRPSGRMDEVAAVVEPALVPGAEPAGVIGTQPVQVLAGHLLAAHPDLAALPGGARHSVRCSNVDLHGRQGTSDRSKPGSDPGFGGGER